jgi:hypothetical protein
MTTKIFFLCLLMVITEVLTVSAEEEIIIDFTSLAADDVISGREVNSRTSMRNPEGFFESKSGVYSLFPGDWEIHNGDVPFFLAYRDYTDCPAPFSGLTVSSYINEDFDEKYAGDHLMRIKGFLSTDTPEAIVRPPFICEEEGLGSIEDVGPINSVYINIQNLGDPVELSLLFVDDMGNWLTVHMATICSSRPAPGREPIGVWYEYFYKNPEYYIISRFPGIKLERLTFAGFIILSTDILALYQEQSILLSQLPEEEKYRYEESYYENPESKIPYMTTEVDLRIADIRVNHGYLQWEEPITQ